jgi:hypothetical protein
MLAVSDKTRFVERALWNVDPFGCRPQSALMLAARITMPHFSVSATTSLPKAADEPESTAPAKSESRVFTLGSPRAALTSLLSLSTISTDVFLGAPKPSQVSEPRHDLRRSPVSAGEFATE